MTPTCTGKTGHVLHRIGRQKIVMPSGIGLGGRIGETGSRNMVATQKNQPFDPGFLFTPPDSFSLGRTVSPQYKTLQTDRRQTTQCTKVTTGPVFRLDQCSLVTIRLFDELTVHFDGCVNRFCRVSLNTTLVAPDPKPAAPKVTSNTSNASNAHGFR